MCNINNFQRIEKIGEGKWIDKVEMIGVTKNCFYFLSGTYGVVFKAINTETGRMVALKRIRLEKYVNMRVVVLLLTILSSSSFKLDILSYFIRFFLHVVNRKVSHQLQYVKYHC